MTATIPVEDVYPIAEAVAAGAIIDIIVLLIEESDFTEPKHFVGAKHAKGAPYFDHVREQVDKIREWVYATDEALDVAQEIIEDEEFAL